MEESLNQAAAQQRGESDGTDIGQSLQKAAGLLRLEPVDIRTYSPLTLAYIGDAVYDLAVRTVLVTQGNIKPHKLHLHCSQLVKAGAQAKVIDGLYEQLTEEEAKVYRRGCNAKPATMAKNATAADYKKATGFEALIGYLYLTGQAVRMLSLIRLSLDLLEP